MSVIEIEAIETPVESLPDNVAEELLDAAGVMISRREIGDASLFLSTDRGAAWLKKWTDGAYYTKWFDHQRSPHGLKWCNEIAAEILDMKRQGTCPGEIEDHIESKFSGGSEPEDVYYEEHASEVSDELREMAEALDELREEDESIPELDQDEWKEALRDRIIEHMVDNDDSSVRDMFGSYDRCELIIELGGSDHVSSQERWADFDNLAIDQTLQLALSAMGYTIGDYRRMTGNRSKGERMLRGLKKRSQPLVSEKELREIVSEACSSNWQFVLYAIVPLTAIFDIELDRPVSLSSYSVATYNGCSGTFYEIRHDYAVTIMPGEGSLTSPTGYAPEDICGLYCPPFHADIANVEA